MEDFYMSVGYMGLGLAVLMLPTMIIAWLEPDPITPETNFSQEVHP